MAIFLLKSNGARFSEDAKDARIASGLATEADFEAEGAPKAPTPAAGTDVVAPPSEATTFILKATGARFSVEAKAARINAGLATEDDFAPEGTEAAPPVAATSEAVPEAVAPAPPVGAAFWKHPSGIVLTPAAAAGYVQRGLCAATDLSPLDADQNPIGAVAENTPAPEPPVLPLNADSFNKNDIIVIAEALGLDIDGSKAAIVARINALGDETGTRNAVAALG